MTILPGRYRFSTRHLFWIQNWPKERGKMVLLIVLSSLLFMPLIGCGMSHPPSSENSPLSPRVAWHPNTISGLIENGASVPVAESQKNADSERLQRLWQKRTQSSTRLDYPIGPGDVLEISVPAMEEISNRTVRVSGVTVHGVDYC